MTAENAIKQLKELKADLQRRIEALDRAIDALQMVANDFSDNTEPTPTERFVETSVNAQPVEPLPHKGKTRNTTFESAIDLTQFNVPEGPWTCKCGTLNPAGSKTCMECKKKRPAGIRTD